MGEHTESKITPWFPEQDQIRLAVLGKLIEELGECTARASRCITHGLDFVDPDTGRPNWEELQREASDVTACLRTLGAVLNVNIDSPRVMNKLDGYRRWHDLIREGQAK